MLCYDSIEQIALKAFMPKLTLDTLVPNELKFFANLHHEFPFFIQRDFLDIKSCQSFCKTLSIGDKMGLLQNSDGLVTKKVDTGIRNTFFLETDQGDIDALEAVFLRAKPLVEAFYTVTLLLNAPVQTLGYKAGCFYESHSDNCSMIVGTDGVLAGFKTVAPFRKMTTVLFLSSHGEDFEGGEFVFDYIFDESGVPITIKPEAGLFVAFPSNPYFTHTVKKVSGGFRISVVKWWDAMIL